jgi:hypothetical protein
MLKMMALAAGLLITGVASQAHAQLTNLGVGGCRTPSGAQGTYTTHNATAWSTCRSLCMRNSNCKGVEYTIRANGEMVCELHTATLGSSAPGGEDSNHVTACWRRTQ